MELMRYLNLEKCRIVGHSMGGVYAAAISVECPELVKGLSLIATIPEFKTFNDFRKLVPSFLILSGVAKKFPALAKLFIQHTLRNGVNNPNKFISELPYTESDEKILSSKAFRFHYAEMLKETGRHFNYICAADEFLITVKPWGYSYEDIKIPFNVWHGTEDKGAPFELVSKIFNKMINCNKHYLNGQGHFFIYENWRPILEELINM